MSPMMNDPAAIYEILVRGVIDHSWEEYFNGLSIRLTRATNQPPVTTLTGPVADQAALRGVLGKLWDLNLTLLSLRLIEAESTEEVQND